MKIKTYTLQFYKDKIKTYTLQFYKDKINETLLSSLLFYPHGDPKDCFILLKNLYIT